MIVYIREAHPEKLKEGNETGIVGRPKTLDERIILATRCVTRYKFTIPTIIDGMDGKVNAAYKSAPVRVTIADRDGNVAYYGAQGPWGFSIPEIERALKKIAGNDGFMPPAPPTQWGQAAGGLRCGLVVDPPEMAVGSGFYAQIKFENVSEEPLQLHYRPAQAMKNLRIKGQKGQALVVGPAKGAPRSRTRGQRPGLQKIEPGQSFDAEIEGILVAAQDADAGPGRYRVQLRYAMDESARSNIDELPEGTIWTGDLQSGTCVIRVSGERSEGCLDCHGTANYHHKSDRECTVCHVGQMGTKEFDVNKASCAQCHPRPGQYGRARIAGEGGEFEFACRHLPGEVTNDTCLLCHDKNDHAAGTVHLIDPRSGGSERWTGTQTGFCLACHSGGGPTAGPEGSGQDKTSFPDSRHGKWLGEHGCLHCHHAHGSAHENLLRESYALAQASDDHAQEAFSLCRLCHDQNRLLEQANAFEKLHGVHVTDEQISCFACHDVHQGMNEGSVRFSYKDQRPDDGFEIDRTTSKGSCTVACHDGKPKLYSRRKQTHTVACVNCHASP